MGCRESSHCRQQRLASEEFTYDGLSRRVRIVEKDNNVVTSDSRFLWCSEELCEERDSTGATTTKRFFPQGEQQGPDSFFYTLDHLGSIRELADTTGTLRARYDYDPYGRTTKLSGDSDASFSFTGHYTHAASSLLLTHYRAYDPTLGRWLSEDPLGTSAGLDRYAYVNNRPADGLDPYGLYELNDFLRDSGNVSSGALEGLLGPLSGYIRNNYSGGDLIDPCSTAYRIGWWAATALPFAITGAEALAARAAARAAETVEAVKSAEAIGEGTKVFRVWGDEAGAWGKSWTTVDPRTVENYRNIAGLPNENAGRYLSEGILQNTEGVTTRGALPLHGNAGGLPEVIIPDPAQQIKLLNVQGLNPQF